MNKENSLSIQSEQCKTKLLVRQHLQQALLTMSRLMTEQAQKSPVKTPYALQTMALMAKAIVELGQSISQLEIDIERDAAKSQPRLTSAEVLKLILKERQGKADGALAAADAGENQKDPPPQNYRRSPTDTIKESNSL